MKKIKIIIMLIFLSALFSCDAFLVPKEARLNPYDSQNLLPQVENLRINIVSDSTGRTINMEWDGAASNVLVIRKTGEASDSVFEGTPVKMISPTESPVYQDSEFIPGKRNYYSVFTYGYKTGYEDNQISLGIDGDRLIDYEYFDFSTPAVIYAEPYAITERIATDDGYVITGGSNWNNAGNTPNPLIVQTVTSVAEQLSCITFDFSAPPEGVVKNVTMVLTLNQAPSAGSGEIEIGPLRNSWSTSTLFSDLNESGSLDNVIYYAYEQKLPCNGAAGDTWEIDITNIFRAFQSGSIDNYGIRLISFNGDNTFYFDSIEGTNKPYIRIKTFED